MKIAYLVPGSGGSFYCENCLRDLPLIQALRRHGATVTLVPLYLPLFSEEESQESPSPIFFGAISYYLDQQFPRLGRLIQAFRRFLDSRPLLRLAARASGSTDARGLESMTLDMLGGSRITTQREFHKLLKHLRSLEPQIIHLSNALLLGLGIALKQALGIPLTCSLQDEDVWLDAMPQIWRDKAYTQLTSSAKAVDHFFPVSRYFARLMQDRIAIDPPRFTVVAPGVDFQRYQNCALNPHPPAIGYLYRLALGYGLDTLAESYLALRQDPALSTLELHISGGYTHRDKNFVRRIHRLLAEPIRLGKVHFYPEFGFGQRQKFFSAIDVLCVPLQRPEAFGSYVLEAMASGIAVVQPDFGAFPEIIQQTNGGLLYNPAHGPNAALKTLLLNPQQRQSLTAQGRPATGRYYSTDLGASTMIGCYTQLIKGEM